MARKTPAELREAKLLRAEERQRELEEQQRLEEAEAAREAEEIQQATELAEKRRVEKDQLLQLQSVVAGLYDEVGKLSAKWPQQQVSDLAVQQTNFAIRSAKTLLASDQDPYLTTILEFVPAGDNPECRDVVLVLRQVKDATRRGLDKRDAMMQLMRHRT